MKKFIIKEDDEYWGNGFWICRLRDDEVKETFHIDGYSEMLTIAEVLLNELPPDERRNIDVTGLTVCDCGRLLPPGKCSHCDNDE